MSKRKRVPFEFHPLKIDSKPGELPDFVATSSERPDFLRGDAGMGGGSIGPDDVVWIAPDADGQLEVRLPRQGYEQYSPFDLILLAIIGANPKGGNEHERLRDAKRALFGAPQLNSAYSRTDDKILLKVARLVIEEIVADRGREIKLAALVRTVAGLHYKPEELVRSEDGENKIVRHLIDRFEKHRDDFLTRATTREDFGRARNLRIIDEIFERLESLAVKVSRKGVPRMQREDDELAPRADET